MTISVKKLMVYPLKSARGVRLERMELTERGPALDRRWMVVEADGTFVSQRSDPALATVAISLVQNGIEASWGGNRVVLSAMNDAPADRVVTVWDDTVRATDVGDEAAEAFGELLGREVRVVYASKGTDREANRKWAGAEHPIGFPDGFPFLITSNSSLRDLEDRANRSIEMDRFRANIVVDGSEAWDEDEWAELDIGGAPFRLVKPCSRCTITTLDQRTGSKLGKEPLKTLGTFRKWDGGVMFGWNAVGPRTGEISVGDSVTITCRR